MRKLGSLAVSSALLLALSGCAPATVYPSASPVNVTACLLTQTDSAAVYGINQELEYSLVQAEVVSGVHIHATSVASWAQPRQVSAKFRALLGKGCNLIFSVGSTILPTANAFALRHREARFINFGGGKALDNRAVNLTIIHLDAAEGAYLAGYLAAAQSTSKVIGTFAAANFDNALNLMAAFKQGAERYAAATDTSVRVLGAETEDTKLWQISQSAGVEFGALKIAQSQVEFSADVIVPFVGSNAAKFVDDFDSTQAGPRPRIIGVGGDWSKLVAFNGHQGAILSSIRFNLKSYLLNIVGESFGSLDQLRGPYDFTTTLGNGGVSLVAEQKVPWVGNTADTIASIRDDIIAGRTVINAASNN